jgi:hypothetical protein
MDAVDYVDTAAIDCCEIKIYVFFEVDQSVIFR